MSWCHRNGRRGIVAGIAAAWVALGFLSDNVPWGSETFWIVACGAAAGSALALARYTTMYALRRYTAITAAIGVVRSAAYVSEDAYGPMSVWIILTLTTIVAARAIGVLRTGERRSGAG